jgi:hypothetical protein
MESPTLGLPNFLVEGDLELRGARAPLTFPVTLGRLADGSFSAEAHFDIDRTRWNVLYGSSRFFEHLGTHLVYDLISIEIRLVGCGPTSQGSATKAQHPVWDRRELP